MKSLKLFVLVFLSTSIVHDQHSKQALGTLTWMANMYIYPQLSQITVLVGSDEYHMRTPVYMFPLAPSLFPCTLRFMTTLEEASSPVQYHRPPSSATVYQTVVAAVLIGHP